MPNRPLSGPDEAAARTMLRHRAAESAERIREVLLPYWGFDTFGQYRPHDALGGQGKGAEIGDPIMLTDLVAMTRAEHTALWSAIEDYPHPLNADLPDDRGGDDHLAHAIAILIGRLSYIAILWHRQEVALAKDDQRSFLNNLREVLIAATNLLNTAGPLTAAHTLVQELPQWTDARWRSALGRAADFADRVWSRSGQLQRRVHRLGLTMLGVAFLVAAIEHNYPVDEPILRSYAEDVLRPGMDPGWERPGADGLAQKRRREAELDAARERITTVLARAGVDTASYNPDRYAPGNTDPWGPLAIAWANLADPTGHLPIGRGGDSFFENPTPPDTWRPNLAEGMVRAAHYLGVLPYPFDAYTTGDARP